jgi:uncharacterized protein YlxW (UPF0749 family)
MDPEPEQKQIEVCRLRAENIKLREMLTEELRRENHELQARINQLEKRLSKAHAENNLMKKELIDMQPDSPDALGFLRKYGV